MRFDDRLRTALAQPVETPHDRAVRWRQLVELVARAPGDGDSALVQQAIDRLAEDRESMDGRVRIAAALAVAALPLPAGLVACFAADRLAVAAPILAGARLTASEWNSVAAQASPECRAFIATMRSGDGPTRSDAPTLRDSEPAQQVPSISDVVARIERLRHSREAEDSPEAKPQQTQRSPAMFRWECNEAGEIEWVDGAPRGALVGQSISQARSPGGVDRGVERAFAFRTPFRDGTLELPRDSAVGGTWRISGVPAFERTSGRFAGYRGVAERPAASAAPDAAASDSDSLRELAHEIKTPLNAIIGFAEIITGEYLGPADEPFRDRAAEIVDQARLLLSAIDDLDLAARTNSPTDDGQRPETDLGSVVEELAPELRDRAGARGVSLDASRSTRDLRIAVGPELARRLVLRLCSAVIDRASAGEALWLRVDSRNGDCRVAISTPAAIGGDPLGADNDEAPECVSLRLVRGLATIAGADLAAADDVISLSFQRA
jgi:signal transduction histidine kinase